MIQAGAMNRLIFCLLIASTHLFSVSDMQVMAKKQAKALGKELYDKFCLYPMDVTVNLKNGVDLIDLRLYCYQELDEREASELIKCSGLHFLDIINNDKELRPFLSHFPFKKVSLRLYCFREDLTEVSLGKVESAFFASGDSIVKLAR